MLLLWNRVKNRRFFVTLTKTHSIPFATLRAAISGGDAQASGHTIDELAAAINIILKVSLNEFPCTGIARFGIF